MFLCHDGNSLSSKTFLNSEEFRIGCINKFTESVHACSHPSNFFPEQSHFFVSFFFFFPSSNKGIRYSGIFILDKKGFCIF